MTDGFSASRIDQHAIPRARRVSQPVRRGTGLYQASLINGREAEPWELEARERAWQAQRAQVDDLLNIRPWSADQ